MPWHIFLVHLTETQKNINSVALVSMVSERHTVTTCTRLEKYKMVHYPHSHSKKKDNSMAGSSHSGHSSFRLSKSLPRDDNGTDTKFTIPR